MKLFIILSLIYWVAVAGATLMLWISIQPGNWLSKWQQQLRKWDLSGNEALYRMFGGCHICFSHLVAQVSFIFYLVLFLSEDWWALGIVASLFWYGIYISIQTNLNLFFITKLHK